jgi:hypothetical protein
MTARKIVTEPIPKSEACPKINQEGATFNPMNSVVRARERSLGELRAKGGISLEVRAVN